MTVCDQKKPDYIPKEKIMEELREIEAGLNALEQRGVELEKKLRRSEEGEDTCTTHTHTHTGATHAQHTHTHAHTHTHSPPQSP